MNWEQLQDCEDAILRSYGMEPLPREQQRRERERELRRDRQERFRERRRNDKQRHRQQTDLLAALEETKTRFPYIRKTPEFSVDKPPIPRGRRRFSDQKKVWCIMFTGRRFFSYLRRAKQLGFRARDAHGRFSVMKTQPLPSNRLGCRYSLKPWHIRACVLASVYQLGTTEIAEICDKHRSTVWKLLHRTDLRYLRYHLERARPFIRLGEAFEIEIEVRPEYRDCLQEEGRSTCQ